MEACTSKKRGQDKSTDWTLCLICQETDRKKSSGTRILTDAGISRIQQVIIDRKRYNDVANWDTIERLEHVSLNEIAKETDILNHKDCYTTFTSAQHISRLKAKYDKLFSSEIPGSSTQQKEQPALRSAVNSKLNTSRCIFCQEESSKKTYLFARLDVSDAVIEAARSDYDMRYKLAGISDLVAADARYHLHCYVNFKRRTSGTDQTANTHDPVRICIHRVVQELSTGLSHGKIYNLLDVWNRYSELLSEFQIEAGLYRDNKSRFKDKLIKTLPGQIDFVPQLESHQPQLLFPTKAAKIVVQTLKKRSDELYEAIAIQNISVSQCSDTETDELLALHHTAVRIRRDIKECPALQNCGSVSKEDAAKVVPQSLYTLICLLVNGELDENEENKNTKRIALSISQDIVYAVSKRKKLTPKHIGIGMALHQSTRSKALVQLVHQAGHCISYDQVRRLDTTLAQQSLNRQSENDNVPVPSNLTAGKFFQFAADNIDLIEETLDGMGTFHATQTVTFQRGREQQQRNEPLKLGRDKSIKIPAGFHQLEHPPERPFRVEPKFAEDVDETWYKPDPKVAEDSSLKDMSWVVARMHDDEGQAVPAWTGFNQITTDCDTPEICSTGYLPLINAPAHEYDTLWTVILRCMKISEIMNPGQSTVITLDQQLYCKVKELQWANNDLCGRVFAHLGGFHSTKNFMCTIGQHFAESGLPEVWIESEVYGENTALNNMQAKSYNRAIRAHKLTYEALWKILWPMFIEWAKQNGLNNDDVDAAAKRVVESLKGSVDTEATSDALKDLDNTLRNPHILQLLDEFEKTLTTTSKYWFTYLKMVSILLQFVRAERTGSWELHVSSFAAMLPWFAVYDHSHYTRWGAVYLADCKQLETTHPDVYQEFQEGNFVVKTSNNKFNQLSTDQALEHVNKVGKTAGGLIGITRSDNARDQWCLTFNEKSRLVDETCAMLDVRTEDDEYSPIMKETGPSRMRRDKQDVQKIVDQLNRFRVFSLDDPDVVCLATRDVAPATVTEALMTAHSRGESKLNMFVHDRLSTQTTGFHEKLKQLKSPTLKSMFHVQGKTTGVQKTVTADRVLFQRLLVSKDSGRDIDLKQVLCHELSPVPLSLADLSGQLRSTNKAALGQILQEKITTLEKLPPTDLRTCAIIDGQALVQALGKPAGAQTFGDLADAFATSVFSFFDDTCSRVDVVFDRYEKDMIKNASRITRSKSSRPIRRKIESREVPLPVNWKNFIDLSENKADLENFLSTQLIAMAKAKLRNREVITSGGFVDRTAAESSHGADVAVLQSSHDEADTRIILHAKHLATEGYERAIISSRDTDVLVLLLHFAEQLSQEVWFRTGTSKQRKYVPVHDIHMDDDVRRNLPAYHALTGCDTVSQFCGLGKKTTWKIFKEHACLLSNLGIGALSNTTTDMVERFVCRLFSSVTSDQKINDVRYKLFQKGTKDPEKLPPTQPSLLQHIKRAHHQSLVWYSSTTAQPSIESPVGNGWIKHDATSHVQPNLVVDDPLPSQYLAITSCRCKNCGTTRCSCRSNELRCTGACGCTDNELCRNPFNNSAEEDENSD